MCIIYIQVIYSTLQTNIKKDRLLKKAPLEVRHNKGGSFFFFFSSASGFLCLLHTLVQPPLRVASGGLAGTRTRQFWHDGRVLGREGAGWGRVGCVGEGRSGAQSGLRLKLQCLFGRWLRSCWLARDLGVKGVWVCGFGRRGGDSGQNHQGRGREGSEPRFDPLCGLLKHER